MNMQDERFCVYVHKDLNGKIRYVGEGTLQRATNFNRPDQPLWMSMFGTNPPTVDIVAQGLTKARAEELEILIRRLHEDSIINCQYASKKAKRINYEFVSEYLSYDTTSPSGLRWKKSTRPQDSHKLIGKASGYLHHSKYWMVYLDSVEYSCHRLVWVLHNKEIPDGYFVDHVDGNRQNNEISNLRLVTPRENSRNKVGKIPVSGYRNIGCHFSKGNQVCYVVRWNDSTVNQRKHKLFPINSLQSKEQALRESYIFRETLIEAGFIPARVREGEMKIE